MSPLARKSVEQATGPAMDAIIAAVPDPTHLLRADGWCSLSLDRDDSAERDAVLDAFAAELEPDRWLPAGHDYRRRAYQCFDVDLATLRIDPIPAPPPYVQSSAVNRVAGGLQRRFRELPATHPATAVVGRLAAAVLQIALDSGIVAPDAGPHVLDAHFIRTTAPGKPCPEGLHRDGLVAGSVHLVELANVRGGETEFTDPEGRRLERLHLGGFLDSVIFDDTRVMHYTADIEPRRPDVPGHRDVLLLGLRAAGD